MPRGGQGSKRGVVTTEIGALDRYIDSFDLVMDSMDRSPRTRELYCDIVRWFAGWLTDRGVKRWDAVGIAEIREFFLYTKGLGYAQSYRNNIGRSLQAYFKFLAAEEGLPNPFDKIKPPPPPKMGDAPPPMIEEAQVAELVKDAEKGRDFASRRDAALLRVFACTGARLEEVAELTLRDLNIRERTAVVTGKAGKTRIVRFDTKCAVALNRYLTVRAEHRLAESTPALWLGLQQGGPLTKWGVRRMMVRRAERLGFHVHPHLWRHRFAHRYLDAGGNEGDLMELTGWESRQMLQLYGRSARSARALRAYDRVDVMGGI